MVIDHHHILDIGRDNALDGGSVAASVGGGISTLFGCSFCCRFVDQSFGKEFVPGKGELKTC